METKTKKSTKKTSGKSSEAGIRTAYIDFVLEQGSRPASVFKFCTDLGIKEDQFYEHFGSFDGVEKHIWKTFIDITIQRLKADRNFVTFSAREKLLAFYYTFFEELTSSRSFILLQLQHHNRPELLPEYLKDFKSAYEAFIDSILSTGKTNGEVAKRPYLDKKYPQILWFHMAFLLIFWKDDNSAGFEKTDAAIEKSVNLVFDLIGKGAVDSVIDFAKFLYQTKVK